MSKPSSPLVIVKRLQEIVSCGSISPIETPFVYSVPPRPKVPSPEISQESMFEINNKE